MEFRSVPDFGAIWPMLAMLWPILAQSVALERRYHACFPVEGKRMAYVLLFACHDPDLLDQWENLLFATGFEVVSETHPSEPAHKILGRASELMQLYHSMPDHARPLGLLMRASAPCQPIMMIADKQGVRQLGQPLAMNGTPEEIVAAVRKSFSA